MKTHIITSALVLLSSYLSHPVLGLDDKSNSTVVPSAYVLRNGLQQLPCEVVPIDSSAAFTSAICAKAIKKDKNNYFQIQLNATKTAQQADKYNITTVHIHPSFNPETYSNNIALLEFNTNNSTKGNWTNPISINKDSWKNIALVKQFNTTQQVKFVEDFKTPDGCKNSSALFKANKDGFICSSWTIPLNNTEKKCPVPFGSIYSSKDSSKAAGSVALFSHAVVYDQNACTEMPQFAYYTVLANYLSWAKDILDRNIETIASSGSSDDDSSSSDIKANSDYKMKDVSIEDIQDTIVVTDKQYLPLEKTKTPSSASSASPASSSETSASPTSSAATASAASTATSSPTSIIQTFKSVLKIASDGSLEKKGISGGAIAAIVIVLILVLICTILGVLYYLKKKKVINGNKFTEKFNAFTSAISLPLSSSSSSSTLGGDPQGLPRQATAINISLPLDRAPPSPTMMPSYSDPEFVNNYRGSILNDERNDNRDSVLSDNSSWDDMDTSDNNNRDSVLSDSSDWDNTYSNKKYRNSVLSNFSQ
ncbi:hypothetical protein GGI12_004756 [Dipsacomyces acuminosporus]|nr:hypothetical protein GGI12_004756 [Dipsacomyces acuminosporus]